MMSRQPSLQVVLCALVAGLLSIPAGPSADEPQPGQGKANVPEREKPALLDENAPLVRGPVPIQGPQIDSAIPAGSGRMSIEFAGNRRWCTFPDDRLQKPVKDSPAGSKRRRDVYIFGYQFSVAAVARAQPDTTLLLFTSPVISTASLRQAGKLGRGKMPGSNAHHNPSAVPDDQAPRDPRDREMPATLVPFWDEAQRCAKVGERFDFDLDPGLYDVYISFDIMLRSGAWVLRSYDYITDIEVAAASRTLVDGMIEMRGGGRRDLHLRSATLQPMSEQGAARR